MHQWQPSQTRTTCVFLFLTFSFIICPINTLLLFKMHNWENDQNLAVTKFAVTKWNSNRHFDYVRITRKALGKKSLLMGIQYECYKRRIDLNHRRYDVTSNDAMTWHPTMWHPLETLWHDDQRFFFTMIDASTGHVITLSFMIDTMAWHIRRHRPWWLTLWYDIGQQQIHQRHYDMTSDDLFTMINAMTWHPTSSSFMIECLMGNQVVQLFAEKKRAKAIRDSCRGRLAEGKMWTMLKNGSRPFFSFLLAQLREALLRPFFVKIDLAFLLLRWGLKVEERR